MVEAILKGLVSLTQANVDTFHANEQALKNVDVARLRLQIHQIQRDHERHAIELAGALERHDVTPPALVRDLKGYLIEGYTAIRSVTGLEGALRAMLANERMLNRAYDTMLEMSLPADLKELLRHNRQDERNHHECIRRMLDMRVKQPQAARAWPFMPNLLPLPQQLARLSP